jgi:hypothetical protein
MLKSRLKSRQMTMEGLTITVLALACAGPAAAQSAAPAGWTAPVTVDGQPDLQGVWANRSVTPLERPEVLANRTRLTDQEVRTLEARADRLFSTSDNDFLAGDNIFLAALANLEQVRNPNATGTVLDMVDRQFDNRTSLIVDPPDGRIPALTSAGQRRTAAALAGTLAIPWQLGQDVDRVAAAARRPLPGGPEDLSNVLRCLTWGVPRIAGNARYDSHYQILQTRTHIVLLSEVNGPRIIPLDGSPHLPAGVRQLNGDSRGRWEGATLVVDTTNFSPNSYFMGSAERLHLVERFTRTARETIEYQMTLDDPTTWTMPWTAMIRLSQTTDRIYEFACHEGNHYVIEGILSNARTREKAN